MIGIIGDLHTQKIMEETQVGTYLPLCLHLGLDVRITF